MCFLLSRSSHSNNVMILKLSDLADIIWYKLVNNKWASSPLFSTS